ncbi:MAG: transposase [Aeromonas sp.]
MGPLTTGSSVTSSISKSSSQQPDRRQHARDTYTKPDSQYPQIARSWQNNWDNLITLFDYPPAIRKVFYTTNAIESPNSVQRKATKQRKRFPTDDTALTVAYLPIPQASKKWAMPIQNWQLALNRFIVEFGDRLDGHLSWSGQ